MSDKTVLVTGSSRGIGRAIALRLARDGYGIVLHCRSGVEQAQEVAQQIRGLGRGVRVLQFDVADRATTSRVLLEDIEAHGCYYGVVCNAGIARDNAFPAMPGEDWDAVIHTNLDSFYNVLNPLTMPLVRRRKPGRIVTLSSVSGIIGNRGQVNYSAAKAGTIGFIRSLAKEAGRFGVTANVLCPGFIDSKMTRNAPPEAWERAKADSVLGTISSVEVTASFAVWLLSDLCQGVTGQIFQLDSRMG